MISGEIFSLFSFDMRLGKPEKFTVDYQTETAMIESLETTTWN